jgi:D-alanyl-D-alanine carboxypeptidase
MSDDGPGTTSWDARRSSTGPARRRLLTWVAAVVVLVVVGASFAVVQVRAARAADVRAATQQAAGASATQAARVAADAAAARTEAARLAQEASLAAERAAAVTTVQAQVAAAEPVLTASAGKVDDDAVRQALATAIEAARTAMTAAAEPASPTAPDAAGIVAAGVAVDTARTAVEAAQATWQQAADAAAAAKKASAASKQAATGSSEADLAAAAAAAKAKAVAGGVPVWVTSVPTADGDGSNGHMPMSSMCLIGWGTDQIGSPQYLRCDAANALARLNDAFRARFGESLAMDLTYRSYDEQVRIAAYYGALAAKPGTSSHGLGTALDVQEWPGVYGFGTERYAWLVANAPTYGWFAPARVRETGAYPEYWHYEYGPGRTS